MDFLFSEVTLWARILNSLISLANHVLVTGPPFYNTLFAAQLAEEKKQSHLPV